MSAYVIVLKNGHKHIILKGMDVYDRTFSMVRFTPDSGANSMYVFAANPAGFDNAMHYLRILNAAFDDIFAIHLSQ